jgi:hypothetical protein
MIILEFNWAKHLMMILVVIIIIFSENSDNPDNPDNFVPDPPGTVTANISESTYIFANNDDSYLWCIGWNTPNNFYLNSFIYNVFICNLGTMKGLENITSIPSTGFTVANHTSLSVACEVGHGYAVKFGLRQGFVDNPNFADYPEVVYVRLYVMESIVNTDGGIIGAKVKYQYPFVP